MNPVFVTGASGFVGSHLVRALVRQSFDVVSVFHKSGIEEDKRHFRLDLRDTAAIEKLFRQFHFSSVIHVAAGPVYSRAHSSCGAVPERRLLTRKPAGSGEATRA